MSDIIVGLDIGTSTVRAVIGELDENNCLQISGVGKSVSTGLRSGIIVNIEATMKAITSAIEAAELMFGCEVTSCYTAIGGTQIDSLNSRGLVAVSNRSKGSREINQDDIDRVIDAARAVALPIDREIIHVLPQSYIIDGIQKTKDPRDMIGVRLEAEVHIVTAALTSMQNIFRCVSRAGYTIDGVMLKTLAATQAVMTEEERELGSILIDIGGGSTDVLVLLDGAPICTSSIPIGGSLVTNDISIVRGISNETAERIKLSDGCCWEPLLTEFEEVLIPGVGGRPPESISRADICRIIQPRMEEILVMVKEKIAQQTRLKKLSGNIVLTGGGALMPGIIELTSHVFDTQSVRIGIPGNLGGIMDDYRTPEYAVAAGLVVAHSDVLKKTEDKRFDKVNAVKKNGFIKTVGNFFKEFF